MRENRARQEFTQHLMFWVPTQESITVHTFGLKVVVVEGGSILSNAKQKACSHKWNSESTGGGGESL